MDSGEGVGTAFSFTPFEALPVFIWFFQTHGNPDGSG